MITVDELEKFIADNKDQFNGKNAQYYFSRLDLDFSKNIDYMEFISALFNYQKHLNNDMIKRMFDLIDFNKDGFISKEELG